MCITSILEVVLLPRSRNTEWLTNMAADDKTQSTVWPTNMAAEKYNNCPSWTLSYLHSPSDCTHLDLITLTQYTVYGHSFYPFITKNTLSVMNLSIPNLLIHCYCVYSCDYNSGLSLFLAQVAKPFCFSVLICSPQKKKKKNCHRLHHLNMCMITKRILNRVFKVN